nr:hypothetical protein [uncultured Rhodopila sp.]
MLLGRIAQKRIGLAADAIEALRDMDDPRAAATVAAIETAAARLP